MKNLSSEKIKPATLASVCVGILGGAALAYALSNKERRQRISAATKAQALQWKDTSAQVSDNVHSALGSFTPTHANGEASPQLFSQLHSIVPGNDKNNAHNSATNNSRQKMLAIFAATLLSKGISSILRFRAEQRAHKRVASAAQGAEREGENDLEKMTVAELRGLASDAEVTGRSTMNKEELVQALGETA